MKKQSWKRFICAGLTVACGMGMLMGCGEEEIVDYSIEGAVETEQFQGESTKSGLAQFEREEVWKESWFVENGGELEKEGQSSQVTVPIYVDAEITVPKAEQMSVVEVKELEFDAAFKETVAENIFDSGEIYYGDMSHLPKKELQKIQDYFDNGGLIYSDINEDQELLLQQIKEMREALDNIEYAKETYTPVEEYTVDEYIGTYNGRKYHLTFLEVAETNNLRRYRQITWSVKDLYEVCPENLRDKVELVCMPWERGDWVENQCELSEEEALKEAKTFVKQLGLDYSVLSDVRPLVWGNPPDSTVFVSETEDFGVNGYVFNFDLGVDDISFVNYGAEENYSGFHSKTSKEEEIQYSMYARLQIFVTDQGVITMFASNPVKITNVSEDVELLPLETIKGIVKESTNDRWETFRFSDETKNFDSMELIYFRVRDKEKIGEYSYVPAWRLGSVSRNVLEQIRIREAVLINAIDGSVIDFYDET